MILGWLQRIGTVLSVLWLLTVMTYAAYDLNQDASPLD